MKVNQTFEGVLSQVIVGDAGMPLTASAKRGTWSPALGGTEGADVAQLARHEVRRCGE